MPKKKPTDFLSWGDAIRNLDKNNWYRKDLTDEEISQSIDVEADMFRHMKQNDYDGLTDEERKVITLMSEVAPMTPNFEDQKKVVLLIVKQVLDNITATKLYHPDSQALPFNERYWLNVENAVKRLKNIKE